MTKLQRAHVSVLLLAGACFAANACRRDSGDPSIPFFEPRGWRDAGRLLIRTGGPLRSVLFVQAISTEDSYRLGAKGSTLQGIRAWRGFVYQYDAATSLWSQSTQSAWDSASGEISDGLPRYVDELFIDQEASFLMYKGQKVETKGKTALCFQVAPQANLIAVLSADGDRSPSYMGFLGRGGAGGQHYHQVYRLPEMIPVGTPVRLAVTSERAALSAMWSADQEFVVYFDPLFGKITVIDVRAIGGQVP